MATVELVRTCGSWCKVAKRYPEAGPLQQDLLKMACGHGALHTVLTEMLKASEADLRAGFVEGLCAECFGEAV